MTKPKTDAEILASANPMMEIIKRKALNAAMNQPGLSKKARANLRDLAGWADGKIQKSGAGER